MNPLPPRVATTSIDLGAMEVVTTYGEVRDFMQVGSPFSIPKAALVLAGFQPGFSTESYVSLEEQLKAFGSGMEITLLSAIPAGSGLGTSSILASTVLGAISDFCGLNWDKNEICNRTLILEQLLTTGGVAPEMGVVDGNGIVGIVYETSPSYSVVISVLNSKSNISCKIIGSDYFGYLKWEHGDSRYAYLKDLPRHAEFNLGDTVVTSGFSTVFPEGIMVGTVDDMSDSNDGLSYLLKIKLATDFGKLSDVRVVARTGQEEQKKLENKVMKE